MSFSVRAGWQIEQVESGGRENNRPTDQLLFRPGYTQRTGRARFFSDIIHVCISSVYACFIVILQDSLMASAERN